MHIPAAQLFRVVAPVLSNIFLDVGGGRTKCQFGA